jgi:hypothetical protein
MYTLETLAKDFIDAFTKLERYVSSRSENTAATSKPETAKNPEAPKLADPEEGHTSEAKAALSWLITVMQDNALVTREEVASIRDQISGQAGVKLSRLPSSVVLGLRKESRHSSRRKTRRRLPPRCDVPRKVYSVRTEIFRYSRNGHRIYYPINIGRGVESDEGKIVLHLSTIPVCGDFPVKIWLEPIDPNALGVN